MLIYTIRPGDTLDAIARRFGLDPARIIADNGITAPENLVVGQSLVLTQPTATYTVARGDNIYTVATRTGTSPNQLWRNNPALGGKTDLTPGQTLAIRYPAPDMGEIETVGYAYPNIDRDVLRATLPYLTYLTLFTYGFTSDGDLIPIEDEEIIALARSYGVAPIMLFSTLGEDGTFSNSLAERLLSDPELQGELIAELAETLAERHYAGIDVDFEYIPAEYAAAYARFITDLREALSPDYRVFVALAPKTSANQRGLLYEGHDYAALGAAADAALLMTYEWGYTYGPPLPVAPLNRVREVVDYALTEIPAEKLLLGIPNYGYDWTLPYVAGTSRAQSLGNLAAVERAWEQKAAIDYDETAQSPYFRYFVRENGKPIEHVVHFEDARSIKAKLGLLAEKQLRGTGVWNIMRFFPQLWVLVNGHFTIRRGLE